MKKNLLKILGILVFLTVLTGCPDPINKTPSNSLDDLSLTIRIEAADSSIDFENAKISQDAVVSKAILIKNLNLDGKKLVLEASGIELQNVKNAVIVIDEKVGEGDITLTECSSISKLEINGGGSNSIHINKSNIANVQVKKNNVRVALGQSSSVDAVVVEASSTKIESEENIVIKAISVNDNVDTITVKGGTVNKIEVVPVEAAPATPGQTEPAAEKTKIVIDGKTEVKSVEGTKDVTLTHDALENGASVSIASQVPVVSFFNSTLTFLTNGNVEGTEFENQDYYYEYYFGVETSEMITAEMDAKLKIYKLANDIKIYAYCTYPGEGGDSRQVMPYPEKFLDWEVKGRDFTFSNLYDTTFYLISAGIVKGEFDADETPNEENTTYDLAFDIADCGMPLKLKFPTNPAKPKISAKAVAQGNEITVTINDDAKRISIYPGEKN